MAVRKQTTSETCFGNVTFKDPLVLDPPLVALHLRSHLRRWMPAARRVEHDELRQTAASKIVPGWTVVAAKEWKPKIECPMLADLRAEAAHRDPKKSVANWNWEKCIEFLTTFPRPPGRRCRRYARRTSGRAATATVEKHSICRFIRFANNPTAAASQLYKFLGSGRIKHAKNKVDSEVLPTAAERHHPEQV